MDILHYADMIMQTNLKVKDKKIALPPRNNSISLLEIKPFDPRDGGFVFYDKSNTEKKICVVAYTEKRNKSELIYCTEPSFRNRGYMSKALGYVLEWLCKNGFRGDLWLLIDPENVASIAVAERNRFLSTGDCLSGEKWYCLYLDEEKR